MQHFQVSWINIMMYGFPLLLCFMAHSYFHVSLHSRICKTVLIQKYTPQPQLRSVMWLQSKLTGYALSISAAIDFQNTEASDWAQYRIIQTGFYNISISQNVKNLKTHWKIDFFFPLIILKSRGMLEFCFADYEEASFFYNFISFHRSHMHAFTECWLDKKHLTLKNNYIRIGLLVIYSFYTKLLKDPASDAVLIISVKIPPKQTVKRFRKSYISSCIL